MIACNDAAAHIMNCNKCQRVIQQFFSQRAGSTITDAKKKASKLNGMKGGRPKKK